MKTELLLLLVSGGVSACFCALLIPVLRRAKAGQPILGYVREHSYKSGTPTMGGVAFIAAAAIAAALFGVFADKRAAVALAFGVACTAVGFLDDFMKFHRRCNLGLRAYQKIVFQAAIALLAGLYCRYDGLTLLYIPFTNIAVDIGGWMIPLAAFVFVAAANCVNLTDGLDGLAASVCFWYFAALAALIFFLAGAGGVLLSRLCLALCGALAGYLLFNTHRASVFMGDTGSLGLGGFAAALAVFSGNALYVAILGIMFVFSGISVILQVIYYKRTGRRLFRMAPLHHHFQQKGYGEAKIAFAYSFVTAAAGVVCLLFVQ